MLSVLGAACGDVKPNKLPDAPPVPDDGQIADAPADAAPPRCDPAKPFGTPVALPALNSGTDDFAASLSADELTVYFSSTRAGGLGLADIYTATRASRTAGFGAPALVAGVTTAEYDGRPIVTANGLAMYVEYRLNANASVDIVRSTRPTITAAFPTPTTIVGINTASNELTPFITPDNSALYFASNRGTAGDNELYVATGAAGSFGAPTAVVGTGLSSTADDRYPVLTPDQLTLYFSSDRAGNSGADVWMSTRANVTTGFGAPVNLSVVNSNVSEFPDWVSADNCVLVLHRNIGTVASNNDLYVAVKPL